MGEIARKLCNALIKDAEADFGLVFGLFGAIGIDANEEVFEKTIAGFKKMYGGLWVGGTAVLTEEAVAFQPNLVNKLVHMQDYSLRIPLSDITAVENRDGFLTKIINIKTAKGTLRIRCFGAPAFAELIDKETHTAKRSRGDELG